MSVARVRAVLPGYATVAHSSEVLHLAPRSVRDLIYSGRLPSLRIGRLHYVRATDLEVERRRRLGLRLPGRKLRAGRRTGMTSFRSRAERGHVDPELRRERAAERSALVNRWAKRHHFAAPDLPFAAALAEGPTACESCGRKIPAGAWAVHTAQGGSHLCVTCGRRVLLDWADRRRVEAAAARRIAQDLGSTPNRNAQGSRAA